MNTHSLGVGKNSSGAKTEPNTQHHVPLEHPTALLKRRLHQGAFLGHPVIVSQPCPHHSITYFACIRRQYLKLACLFSSPLYILCQEQYLAHNRCIQQVSAELTELLARCLAVEVLGK